VCSERTPRKSAMVVGFALGLLHANAVEWLTHKYVLHGLGRRKGSLWRFHWAQHHRIARKNAMYDRSYEAPFWDWKERGKEIAGILGLAVAHLPLLKLSPSFTAAVIVSSFNYLYRHRKCHLDVEWGKKHMPSHYDHHMGPNQDANWCVSYPLFDYVLRTRVRAPEERARPVVAAPREPAPPVAFAGRIANVR
jgi:sterol desaturase/sphingolipid hydroxylase (fatty acid hydroxylase superfamily)